MADDRQRDKPTGEERAEVAGEASEAAAPGENEDVSSSAPPEEGYEALFYDELPDDYLPARPRKKRRVGRIVLVAAAVLVAGAIGVRMLTGALAGPAPIYAELAEVTRGNVQQALNTSGLLASGEKMTLYAPVTAPVQQLHVELGRIVTEGELVASFDDTDLLRSYRTAEAALGLADLQQQNAVEASGDAQQEVADWQASVESIREQLRIAQERAAQIAAQYALDNEQNGPLLMTLQRELEAAELQYKLVSPEDPNGPALKQELLDEINRLTKEIYDREAPLKSLANRLQLAQTDVTYHETLLAQLEGRLNQAELAVLDEADYRQMELQAVSPQVSFEIAAANLRAARAGLSAPFTGVVTSLPVEQGARVAQYAPVCIIESIAKVNVVVSLSRYDLERVREGQTAVVNTAGQRYTAVVSKINAMATQSGSSSYVSATIRLDAPDGNIRLGLEADVSIATGSAQGVLMAPISAINTDVNGTYCYISVDGVAERRNVEIGLSGDSMVEIVAGLAEGDTVVLNSQNVEPGARLTTDPAYAPKAGLLDGLVG